MPKECVHQKLDQKKLESQLYYHKVKSLWAATEQTWPPSDLPSDFFHILLSDRRP